MRHFFVYVEGSLVPGTEWAIFEPNGEPLWSRLRHSVVGFLNTLWKSGVYAGTTIEVAFFVRYDRSTHTQEEIDMGIVYIMIVVEFLRPAEVVIFHITQRTGLGR